MSVGLFVLYHIIVCSFAHKCLMRANICAE